MYVLTLATGYCISRNLSLLIISKPNKLSYDISKSFCPIILLYILGKLIKKVISNRIQVYFIMSNFLYPNQLEDIRQWSTTNTEAFLTHIIYAGWIKGLWTSTLVFDITQFFLLFNYQLFLLILTKVGFNNKITQFFSSYLIDKHTQYV